MAEIDRFDSSSADNSFRGDGSNSPSSGPPESESFWRQNVGKGAITLSILVALGRGLVKLADRPNRPAAPAPFQQQGDPAAKMQELLRKVVPVDPEVEAAIAAATTAIEQNPDDAAPYRSRGLARARKGEDGPARADFSEAIRLDPTNAEAFVGRGILSARQSLFDEALADFNEAHRLAPTDPRPLAARGEMWNHRREYERAIADYQAAIEIDPDFGAAHIGLAWIYATCPDARFRDGKKGVAHGMVARVLLKVQNPHWIAAVAAAHAENGDFDRAMIAQHWAHELYSSIDKARWGHLRKLYKEGKPWRESATDP